MARTSNVHQLSQNENFIFFSSLMSVNLALTSKDVKCYQKWLKMGLNQNYCPFLAPILMIYLFTYALHS